MVRRPWRRVRRSRRPDRAAAADRRRRRATPAMPHVRGHGGRQPPSRSARRRGRSTRRGPRRAPRRPPGPRARSPPPGTSSHATSYRSSRCIIDEPWCRLVGHEHGHVAAAGQGACGDVGPADRQDHGVVGDRGGQRVGGRVVVDLVGQLPRQLERLLRREQVGAQPPQRPALGMSLDDPSAGDDEARTDRTASSCIACAVSRTSDAGSAPGPGRRTGGARSDARYVDATAVLRRTLPGDRYHRSGGHRTLASDLMLAPLGAASRPLEDWLTTFHLASVVLDPYTNESSWILKTAARILEGLRGSDARVNFVVTSDADDAKAFLGPLADEFLVFCDPDRATVEALGLSQLPAFVFIRVDGTVGGRGRGLEPRRVAQVAETIAEATAWLARRSRSPVRSRAVPTAHRHTTERGRAAARPPGLRQPSGDPRRRSRRHGRAVLVAPPGAGKTTIVPLRLLDEDVAGRSDDRDARTASAGHACRGATDGRTCSARRSARPVGYQTRDERRIGRDTRHRGRHRGRAHPTAAARPRVARRRADRVRRGARAQPADRPRPGADARRRRQPASRPARPGDVGDARHRSVWPPCSAALR